MKTSKPIKTKKDGNQVLMPRIIYLEPELWNMYDRLAYDKHITRSTYIRAVLKNHKLANIDGVDWSERTYI